LKVGKIAAGTSGPDFRTWELRAHPQTVAPVSRPAVLAASKPPETVGSGVETCTTAALESGATKYEINFSAASFSTKMES
jgi:hypothetical protein